MRTKLHRRDLLRSAAASWLLLPVVRSTMALAGEVPIRRFITLFTPNGLNYVDAGPSGGETSYDVGDYYRPLERHKDALLALSGLHIGGVPFGQNTEYGHKSGGIGCLTCTPDELTGKATGPSIDQFIAQKLNDQGRAPTRRAPIYGVGTSRNGGYVPVYFESSGVIAPTETNPVAAFQAAFPNATAGTDVLRQLKRKKSILDAAWQDCRDHLPALSQEGKTLLDYHCTRIRELEDELTNGINTVCLAPQSAYDPVKALNPATPDNYPPLTDFWFKLMEVSLLCDLTRVVSFTFGDDAARFNMPWVNPPQLDHVDTGETNVKDHHSHTHAGTRDSVGLFMTWYSTKIAGFIDRLRAATPAGPSLLSTTNVLWMTEYGGAGHSNFDTPMFVFGDGGGTFRLGRHLHFSGGTEATRATPTHALFVSLIQAAGLTGINQFGHPGGGSGPLAGAR